MLSTTLCIFCRNYVLIIWICNVHKPTILPGYVKKHFQLILINIVLDWNNLYQKINNKY